MLLKVMNKILDSIYPPRCINCKHNVSKLHSFCPNCWKKIEFISKPWCKKCCLPMPVDYLDKLCYGCYELKPKFNSSRAIFRYTKFTKKLIANLKSEGKGLLAKHFAMLALGYSRDFLKDVDIIIPVPVHQEKLLQRKFNPIALVGRHISKALSIELMPDALIQQHRMHPQKSLTRQERLQNIKGVFKINRIVEGKRIVLLDDVMTTGATANECSIVLKQNKAKWIKVLALARRY